MKRRRSRAMTYGAILFALTCWLAVGTDDRGAAVVVPEADAAYYYAYLPSLVLDRDLDFANQYEAIPNFYHLPATPLGRPGNVFGVGPALCALPLFLLGHGLAAIAGHRTDGYSTIEHALVAWANIPFAIGALLLAARLLRRRLGMTWQADLAATVAFAAGPTLYYVVRQPGYAHVYAAFFTALFVERWDASFTGEARSLRTWIVLGASFGACVLVRPQLATWGVLLVIAAIDDLRRGGRMNLAGAASAIVVVAPQLVVWARLYGDALTVPQGPGFLRWDAIAWSEVLVSARNGLLVWAPLAVVMLAGLGAAIPKHRRLALALLLGFALQVAVNGAAWDWWAGGSFGGRRFDSCYVVLAVGAGVAVVKIGDALRRARESRGRFAVACLAALAAACALAVTLSQVELAARTSSRSARIEGGEAPATVWRDQLAWRGELAAWLADAIAFPARTAFGLAHDVSSDTYDRIVGVHTLGETYPGLNTKLDQTSDALMLRDLAHPRFVGLARDGGMRARLLGDRARILFSFNRRGGVRFTVLLRLAVAGHARVGYGGTTVERDLPAGEATVELDVPVIDRGVGELVIEAPPETRVLSPITITALP